MSDFVHLHVHTDFSLLDGAASVKKLVARAKELGQKALAITDHGNMFGVIRFYKECRAQGIIPLIGSEFYVAPEGRAIRRGTENGNRYYHLVLIAKNEEGYRNLMKLSSRSYIEGMYYKPRIDEELIRQYSSSLVCLSACLAGELPTLLMENKNAEAEAFVEKYRNIFGAENFFIELQDHGIPEQKQVAVKLIDIATRMNVPMVVTNDVHYCNADDYIGQDILLCIGTKRTRNEQNRMRFFGNEFYLKSGEEMAKLFPNHPQMLENTVRIAEMCDFKIPQPGAILPIYEFPKEFASKEEFFRHLIYTGLKKRYGEVTDRVKERAEYEINIITKMDFVGYFLIVWDFINWARENKIPVGPGRGSGAGSIVAYSMAITDIDPLRFNLLFERFLNPERISMPDFDVDFCFEGRQAVIDYVRQKYGDDRVAQIITFGTLKAKAAIKDVGRALEIPLGDVNSITKQIPDSPKTHLIDAFEVNNEIVGSGQLAPMRDDARYSELFDIAFKLEDSNRNTSLHASGLVIGREPLTTYVPLYKDTKTGKTATQFTMDLIENCGLVKMDFLGLKTLTLIKYAESLIQKRGGEYANFSTEQVSETDEATFIMLSEGKSAAVFQFESQGMQNILKRAKPNRIEDLIALNALYRPGPMAYIDQFIESKLNPQKISYPDPCLKDILEETYGVIVYQEQVMQVAQRIAGYSLGKADMLRRAMGKKKKEVMVKEKETFIDGALKNGFSAETADKIFEILIPFAGYGFNKSHAAAYSVLAYRTAYLKANFPAEFIAANLTNEITSTDKLPEYIAEGRAMGLSIDPPDVNRSDRVFDVVDGRIVYGLLGIKGLGDAAAEEIISQRKKDGSFVSFIDFLERVDLRTVNKKAIEVLVKTGSFDNLTEDVGTVTRSMLLLNMERAVEYAESKKESQRYGQVSLFEDTGVKEFADFTYEQAEDWTNAEKLRIEKELIGFYISGHPLDTYRQLIASASTLDISHLEYAQVQQKKTYAPQKFGHHSEHGQQGKTYTIIGMIRSTRAILTKKQKYMAFGTFEDYNGTIDLTIFSDCWEKHQMKLTDDSIWALTGKVDVSRDTPSFIVEDVIDPNDIKAQEFREIHIKLHSDFQERQLDTLRDILFSSEGSCSIFFHVNTANGHKTVKANTQIAVPSSNDFIETIENLPLVEAVWKE